MGKMFVPTLINTAVWEPYTWDEIRMELKEEFFRLAKRGDVEKIYEKIKNYLEDVSPEDAKKCIRDFIEDAEYASGVVSATSKAYQDVILAILDVFSSL
ncbi:MAG: hypothetical protein QXI60_07690 [Thermofilaceae archaeon]